MLNNTVTSTVDTVVSVNTPCYECGVPHKTEFMRKALNAKGNDVLICAQCSVNHYVTCTDCGNVVHSDYSLYNWEGKVICQDCYESDYATCECCDCAFPSEDIDYYPAIHQHLCASCVETRFATCERCHNVVYETRAVETTGDTQEWCIDCCQNHGYFCSNCGILLNEGAAYWHDDECYCESCYDEMGFNDDNDVVIQDYHYHKGKLNDFYLAAGEDSANVLTFGVELEIDEGGFDHDNARQILGNFRGASVVAERDGSLDNGFEMISYPFSLKYYKETMRDDYEKAFKTAVSLGYVSHNTDTCGLHVHVGRQSLGVDKDQQTDTISKIWLLMHRFQEAFTLLSRRKLHKLNQWARMPKTEDLGVDSISELMPIENLKVKVKALDGNQCVERRIALNLQNSKTIEFRLFRGTLNINTFTATLQLVHNVCYLCKILTLADVSNITWTEFVRLLATDSPELLSYLKSKNLYTA